MRHIILPVRESLRLCGRPGTCPYGRRVGDQRDLKPRYMLAPATGGTAKRQPSRHAGLASLQSLAGNKATARLVASTTTGNGPLTVARSVGAVAPIGTELPSKPNPSGVQPRRRPAMFLQRAPGPGGDVPARGEMESIRDQAVKRNQDLGTFLKRVSDGTIPRLRAYYAGLNSLYAGKYDVYTHVLSDAGKHAQSEQQVVNFLWGAVSAIAISAFAEVVVPAEAFAALATRYSVSSAAARTAALNVGSNVPSSAASTFLIPYTAPGLNVRPTESLNPAFKQIAALQQVDRVSSLALGMASPAPQGYANSGIAAERIIGELRVREAKGAREQSDTQLNQVAAQLRQADKDAAEMDKSLVQAEETIREIEERAGQALPTGARVEYDMWITWIAALTEADGGWYPAHNLNNSFLKKHFTEIGLDNELGVGGKMDATPFLNPRGWHWDVDMYLHAQSALPRVNSRWHRYLLLDETSANSW